MRRIISNTGKALHSIVSEHLRQHTSVHNIPALVTPPPVARWGDDKVYHDQAARVKVHFNVSTPCIYDMLTRQEQHLSTVDNNLVQEAAQQHQSVPHISLSSNWGIRNSTSRQSTTTWFKRLRSNTNLSPISPYLRIGESLLVQQQGYVVTKAKKQTTSGLGFRPRRHEAPSDQGRLSTINRQELLYMELALTDDMVRHGDIT